jgi:hypothetical protein
MRLCLRSSGRNQRKPKRKAGAGQARQALGGQRIERNAQAQGLECRHDRCPIVRRRVVARQKLGIERNAEYLAGRAGQPDETLSCYMFLCLAFHLKPDPSIGRHIAGSFVNANSIPLRPFGSGGSARLAKGPHPLLQTLLNQI